MSLRMPFVPSWEGKAQRALHDGGPDERVLAAAGRDGLLPHRLGVRVRVGPAPGARPVHARLHQLLREPDLALAARGQPQRLLVLRVPPLILQSADAGGSELRGEHAVIGLRAEPRHQGVDVLELRIDDEGNVRGLVQVVRLRIAADERLVLEYRAAPRAGDEAGGDVAERGYGLLAQFGRVSR